MNLRCITDKPRDCATNIALDEIVFTNEQFIPTFRFYTWTRPSYTIGYFQKFNDISNCDNYPIIRRLTGGLTVLHSKDLSFSFIVSDEIWPNIYDQGKTYKLIHETIKKTLVFFNIICDESPGIYGFGKNISCVDTFYKDDVFLNGKKIVGSCQRRRGKKILIEGSIHLHFDEITVEKFAGMFFSSIGKTLNCAVSVENLTDYELNQADQLANLKYRTDKWSKLF
ncbi:MAG: hypothetical protein PHR82_00860 [Endomicrobiaceae bacterium]|nr:hypothetical protein [Endomicrobiaceae bacterium]